MEASNEREPGGWETGSVWPASLAENGELPRFSEMLSQEGGEQRHPKSSPDLCLHIHASAHTQRKPSGWGCSSAVLGVLVWHTQSPELHPQLCVT